MEKQNRRVLGFVNPDIIPVDQDQWERLKKEIESIHPVSESNNNAKWGIIGFCGSLLISLIYYSLSSTPNIMAIGIPIGLIVGLLLASWAFGKVYHKEKHMQKITINRCKETVEIIENRLRKENADIISAALIEETSSNMLDKDEQTEKLLQVTKGIKESPKDILSKLNVKNKLR
jgi:hypothetical protein